MDGLYVDMDQRYEIDIDDRFDISGIKEIEYDPDSQMFYCLANKKAGLLGLYLIKIYEKDPYSNSRFVFKQLDKLNISDCELHILWN